MNTSIVFPLGTGSRWNNTELRFALRSVEKHLTGYGDIFIIGEYPSFLKNCIHIPATDIEQTWAKERNIFNKIMLACEDPRVSSSFLFCNDDHFLLEDFEAGDFPYYWDGSLKDVMRVSQYKNTVANTMAEISGDVQYFDVHCPIVYNKKQFKYVFEGMDWSKPYGYCLKTTYTHSLFDPLAIQYPDLKINQPLPYAEIIKIIAGRPWFSIGDAARQGDMLQVLEDLYSTKSRYEK